MLSCDPFPSEEALEEVARRDLAQDAEEVRRLLEFVTEAASLPSEAQQAPALRAMLCELVHAAGRRLDAGERPDQLWGSFRELLQLLATLRTLGHWQSPLAKRPHEMVYHRQFVPQDSWCRALGHATPFAGPCADRALFFSSMMGALTAVVMAAPDGPVLVDRGSYVELRELVQSLASRRLSFVDPRVAGELANALENIHPSLVLLDLAPNLPEMPLTRVETVIEALRVVKPPGPRWTVLDHSLLGPLWEAPPRPAGQEVILLGRSLQKLDQRGLDLSPGGLLLLYGRDDTAHEAIVRARAHTGTELPERDRWYLELPDAETHQWRRLRAYRNGQWLAQHLRVRQGRWPGVHVYHCSDSSHPIWQIPEPRWPFCPPILHVLLPVEVHRHVRAPEELDRAIGEPPLPMGASFGFRHTRVSWWSDGERASLRVDVGLEPADLIAFLASSLGELLDRLWAHARIESGDRSS